MLLVTFDFDNFLESSNENGSLGLRAQLSMSSFMTNLEENIDISFLTEPINNKDKYTGG